MFISTSSTGWKNTQTNKDKSAAAHQPGHIRKIVNRLLQLLIIAVLLYLVFYRHGEELLENLKLVGMKGLAVLIVLAAVYQALDAAGCLILIRRRLPTFTFRQSVELMELGFFFQITTMSVGSVPAQGAYLRNRGLMMGDSLGLMAMNYVLHKSAVLLAAIPLLAATGWQIAIDDPALRSLLIVGTLLFTLLIGGMMLICTWEPMHRLACRLLSLLPKTEAWQGRKETLLRNLDALREESRDVWHHPHETVCALLLHAVKHLWVAFVPVVCLALMHIKVPLLQTMQLAVLCQVVSGAIPNVAGLGPAEFSFLLLFSTCLEPAQAASALVLYRCVTYFLPFLASLLVTRGVAGRVQCQRKRKNAYEETKKERS